MSQQLSGRSEQSVPERFVPAEMQGELVELEHLARYEWAATYATGKRVLDAGCGVGYGTALLARSGALEATGVDVAEPIITAAGTEHQLTNAKFTVGDVTSLDFPDDSFDLIVCFEVIEHVEAQEKVFDELTRLLAPEGVLLISSPNPESYPSGNPHHIRELRPAELKGELTKRFSSVQTLAQENWLVSALFDEQTLQLEDGSEIKGGLRATKHQSRVPEFRTYTVCVASNATLPQPELFGAFGPPTEVKRWLEIYREQDQVLQEQRGEITKQGIYYGDRGDEPLEELAGPVDVAGAEREVGEGAQREVEIGGCCT